jgi:hypothetical protein
LRAKKVTDGDVTQVPVKQKVPIDLGTIETEAGAYFYGVSAQPDPLVVDVEGTGTRVPASAAGDVTIPWTGNGVYLWFWIPNTAGDKTNWEDPNNSLNRGGIGGSGDLFEAGVGRSAEGRAGKIYITELRTVGRPLIVR